MKDGKLTGSGLTQFRVVMYIHRYMTQYLFRLPDDQLNRLRDFSHATGLTVSHCVRQGIEMFLNSSCGVVASGAWSSSLVRANGFHGGGEMSGAWEYKQARKVLVGILHTDLTTIAWAFGLRNLIVPGEIMPVAGMPYDHARNTICDAALKNGFEYAFHFDSDVVPPRDVIIRLLAHNKPLVSAVYCRRSPPHGVPVCIKGGNWVTQLPPNQLIEVDYVGAGAMLIHRSVLEAMKPSRPGKPWFDWRIDMRGLGVYPDNECLSEDFVFCQAAKKIGVPTFVDTSIHCKHVGLAEATYGNFQPLQVLTQT